MVLEVNNRGLLAKKEFFDINDMEKVNFLDDKTESSQSKRSFVYDFLSSMRQKINDPLGVRKREREKKRKRVFK